MRFPRPFRSILPLLLLAAAVAGGCGKDSSRRNRETAVVDTRAAQDTLIPAWDPRLKDLQFLRSQPPSLDVDIAIGNLFYRQGELDSALAAYQDALARDSTSLTAWNYLGICLAHMERYKEASKAYHKALDLDAYHLETHINLGNLRLTEGDLQGAVNEYLLASTIDSTDARVYLNLGLAYEKQQQDNPAILSYRQAARLDPQMSEASKRLGWIYYNHDLYTGALESWLEALDRDPTDEELRENVEALQAYLDSTRAQ